MTADTADAEITWAAYLRLSRLKSRKRQGPQRGRYRNPDESVQRQRMLVKAYAAEHGLSLPDELIFEDNGRSGWQKPGGPPPHRPDWERMIRAGKDGRFGGLLTWKLDRFARNVRDGEDLADLGVLLDGPVPGRIDLRTADGLSHFRQQIEAAPSTPRTRRRKRSAPRSPTCSPAATASAGPGGCSASRYCPRPRSTGTGTTATAGSPGPAAVVREDEAEVIRELAAAAARRRDRAVDGRRPERAGHHHHAGRPVGAAQPVPHARQPALRRAPGLQGRDHRRRWRMWRRSWTPRRTTPCRPSSGPAGGAGGDRPLPAVRRLVCGNPACAAAGHDGRVHARRHQARLRLRGARQAAAAAVGARRAGRGDGARCGARRAGRRGADGADARPPTPPWTSSGPSCDGLLGDLDADMAETEAQAGQAARHDPAPRPGRAQPGGRMEARDEAAARELDGLGPAAAPAPPLPVMTAGTDGRHHGGRRRRSSAASACASRSCRPPARRAPRGCVRRRPGRDRLTQRGGGTRSPGPRSTGCPGPFRRLSRWPARRSGTPAP